jgi:hypothetical protein
MRWDLTKLDEQLTEVERCGSNWHLSHWGQWVWFTAWSVALLPTIRSDVRLSRTTSKMLRSILG